MQLLLPPRYARFGILLRDLNPEQSASEAKIPPRRALADIEPGKVKDFPHYTMPEELGLQQLVFARNENVVMSYYEKIYLAQSSGE